MFSRQPLVSIITPTFNSSIFLLETLNSIVQQTYTNWECVLVDDGSTDDTLKILDEYVSLDERFKVYNRPNYKAKGPSACRNFGIEKSRGEFIVFLDSDDLLAKFCLQRRIDFALNNPNFDLWIFPMQTFIGSLDNKKQVYGFFDFNLNLSDLIEQFHRGLPPFYITCPLWLKTVLVDLGGFNERLTICTDPDLHLRMLEKDFKAKFYDVESADSYYRLLHNYNKKNNSKKILKNHLIFFDYHLNYHKIELKNYYREIISKYIFSTLDYYYLLKYLRLGIKKKVINHEIYLYSFCLMIYHCLNLSNSKGIGYNRLKAKFNSCFW